MEIIHLEKNNFKELISSENKILVDFYATWCGPCKMLGPVLENYQSTIKVIKVDTDAYPRRDLHPQREHRRRTAAGAAGSGAGHPRLLPEREPQQTGGAEAGGHGLYGGL